MYWVDNPIWLAGTLSITAMAAFSTFFVNLSLAWEYVFGLLFIWLGIASVIMALKFGKWVATIGAAIRIFLIAFFTLTVFIYAGEHGLHGFGAGAFKPTWLIFLAAAPILIFNLEGFELPAVRSIRSIRSTAKDLHWRRSQPDPAAIRRFKSRPRRPGPASPDRAFPARHHLPSRPSRSHRAPGPPASRDTA
jgi:hypothetical protein